MRSSIRRWPAGSGSVRRSWVERADVVVGIGAVVVGGALEQRAQQRMVLLVRQQRFRQRKDDTGGGLGPAERGVGDSAAR
ncbi:hypothetical protein [Streptomyces sp. NPDC001970]